MDEVEIQDKEMDVLDTDEDATKETESKRKASCNGDLEKKILINLDVDEKNPSATLDSESVAKSPTTSLSFVDDIMGALSDRGIKVNSRDSTASTPSQEVPDSGTGSEGQATSPGVCKPLYSRSISDCEAKEPTQGKPALASPPPLSSRLKPRLASPPPLSTKPKPLDKTRSARSSVTSTGRVSVRLAVCSGWWSLLLVPTTTLKVCSTLRCFSEKYCSLPSEFLPNDL